MPHHRFHSHPDVREAVKQYVQDAIDSVPARRYNQEANYMAALAARLEGVAYDGPHGHVEFHSTVFDDRGRGSTESKIGADIAITATISDGTNKIRKVILIQAKSGLIEDLTGKEEAKLHDQIRKMQSVTRSPKVIQLGDDENRRPQVISGTRIVQGDDYRAMDLPGYFTARVLTTFDGDTRPEVVERASNSAFVKLDVQAQLNDRTRESEREPIRRNRE